MTQADFAKKSGLSRGYYSQLEKSRKCPPPKRTMSRIVDALELTHRQRYRLMCLATIEREKENFSLGKLEELEAILKDLAFKADSLSANHLQEIAKILRKAPSP